MRIAQLREQLTPYLRDVERGGEIEVTDRDRPIARIVPVRDAPVTVRCPTREFTLVRGNRYPPPGWSVSSTDLLLEERQRR